MSKAFIIQNQNRFNIKTIESQSFRIITPTYRPFQNRSKISPLKPINKVSLKNDIIYQSLKPVVFILHILGILPLSRNKRGWSYFDPLSFYSVYSAILYFSILLFVYLYSPHKVHIYKSNNSEGKFEEFVIEYLFTVYLFPLIFVPVTWYEARKIAVLFNTWTEYEISYKKILNKPLPLKTAKRSLFLAIFVPLLSLTSVFTVHLTMIRYHLLSLLPYIYYELTTSMLGCYWYCLCDILIENACILADDFQLVLRNIGPSKRVAHFRSLWLHLSKLIQLTGWANCYTFSLICLYLFLIITLSVYGVLSQISEGIGLKDIGLTVTALSSIGLLFCICNHAHCASQNVQKMFQKKLLMIDLSWLSNNVQTEINMFLRATGMNQTQISLGGFVSVDRSLFKTLQSTMVTYLVVLLQFQMSIPEEDLSDFTEANVTRITVAPIK